MLQYKCFFDLSVDLLCIVTLDGSFREVNPAFQHILGYSEEELRHATIFDFIHHEDQATTRRELEQLASGKVVTGFENRCRSKNGHYAWLTWTSQANLQEGLIYGIARDITAQKTMRVDTGTNERLQQEIEERRVVEARLAGILNLAFDAIISVDETQRITLFNYGAAQMFGYTPEEAIGQPLDLLLPTPLIVQHAQHIRDFARSPVMARRMHERGIVYARRKNGVLFPAEASISKLVLDGESVFTVFMRDVSKRLAAQEASDRLAAIVDATSDMVYISRRNEESMYLNRAGYHMLGIPESVEPREIDLSAFYTQETLDLLNAEALPAAFKSGFWSGDGAVRARSGSIIPVSIVLLAHRENDGQLAYIAAIVRDISASKQVEDELRANLERARELNNLKTRFLAMVSHEFMTPLTIMLTACELIRNYSDRMPPEKRVAHLEKIEAHIRYLSELVSNVLTVNRAESVGMEFKPKSLDMNAFLRDLIDEMQLVAETHRLEFFSAAPCPVIWADERLLRQMFINLISNAVKYSPGVDRVNIDVTCPSESAIEIRVRDYGIGIPLEDQPNLFSSFFRAQNVGMIPGTGLGLAVIHRAVSAHGGTVELDSQVGSGTTFIVRLPTTPEPREPLIQ